MVAQRQKIGFLVFLFTAGLILGFGTQVLAKENSQSGKEDYFKMSLEELMNIEVSSTGFFKTSISKAPGYVMVYDMNTIDDTSSVRTLYDLLELHVPGIAMGKHATNGGLIGTRGLTIDNGAKTLVMWDGQQINHRQHFGYMAESLSPFLGDVSKIEVIHGPGAIQHGSGAISGFINMIPKTGATHPGLFAKYEYGFTEVSNLFESGYGYSYGAGKDVYIYGGAYQANGFEPDEMWGGTKSYTGNVNAYGFGNDNYRFSTTWNHDDFSLNTFFHSISPRFNNSQMNGYMKSKTMAVSPKYTLELSETDSVEFVESLVLMDHSVFGQNGNNYFKGGSERHMESKIIYRTTRFNNHSFAIGGLIGRKDFYAGKTFFSKDPRESFEAMDTHWLEMGIFAEDVIKLTDNLTLSLGIRYDKLDTTSYENETVDTYSPESLKGHISPRIALAYEIDPKTSVKVSYQHGYRTPDAAYYLWNSYFNNLAKGLGYTTSAALQPETMDSYELNFKKILSNRLTLGANFYYNIFKNQLRWSDMTDQWTPAQVTAIEAAAAAREGYPWSWIGAFDNAKGKTKIYGTEIFADYKLTENTDISCSYGFAKAKDNEITQQYPPHQIKLNLASRFLDNRLTLGMNYVFNSKYTHSINPNINDVYEGGRNLVDLFMVFHVSDTLKIKGVVKNIFGENTPGPTDGMGTPDRGNLGCDEPRFYVSVEKIF